MKKLHYLVVATCVTAASGALAQENVSRTEKTVTQSESANGSSRVTKTVTTTVTTYVDQLRTVYQSAGLPADVIDRLVELDRRIYQAYVAGDWSTVRTLRIQQRQLLNPDQVTRVYTYFQSNPLPAEIAPIATYTYVPQQQFQTHIVQNESGRIQPGTLNVPGVSATANVQRSETEANRPGTTEIKAGTSASPSGSATIKSDTKVDSDNPTVGTQPAGTTGEIKAKTDMDNPNATELKPEGTSTSPAPGASENKPGTAGYSGSNAPHPSATNPAGQQHADPSASSTGGQSSSAPAPSSNAGDTGSSSKKD